EKARNSGIDSTAMGTDADTVSPTFRTRYSDDAPKMMPRTPPVSTVGQVNSGGDSVGGTNGWCAGASGSPALVVPGVGSDDMSGVRCESGAGRGAAREQIESPPARGNQVRTGPISRWD